MSLSKELVDYKCLEEELQQAVRDDELYQLKNDAKIRAVEQRVPTYDQFREMVNGAHLRPLDRADIKSRIPISKNSFANKLTDWTQESLNVNISEPKPSFYNDQGNVPKFNPKDTKEFMNIWKRLVDPNLKIAYLLDMRIYFGKTIFPTEIPCEFLEEVIDLCSKRALNDKIQDVIEVFIIFSRCNRFQLNISFLIGEKKVIFNRFLKELISTEKTGCQELKEKYKIILN